MRVRRFLPALGVLALLLTLEGCGYARSRGSVNGVSFEMALRREAVPGGTPYAIAIEAVGGTLSTLSVDGVPFGQVTAGDRVEVDQDGVVWVNGVVREPKR